MKLAGMGGVGTGKLGSMVYSCRAGQQIVRQYQPNVANPSTEAQVASRSKMKLLSQLAAVVAPVIAVNAEGLKSKRNLFISENYSLSAYAEGIASIELEGVQLTKSTTSFPDIDVTRDENDGITIKLAENVSENFDRVVYCVVIKTDDGSFRLYKDVLVTEAGAAGDFQTTVAYTPNAFVVYGYGVRANSEESKAAYDNLGANAAGQFAQIVSQRRATMNDITISSTKGAFLGAGATNGDSSNDGNVTINVISGGNGTVSGGGTVAIGTSVTLTATPASGYRFKRWIKTSNNTALSTANPYTFAASANITIRGEFEVIPQEEDGD